MTLLVSDQRKYQSLIWLAGGYLAVLAIYTVARECCFEGIKAPDSTLSQLLALPPLAWGLSQLRLRGTRIPQVIIWVALVLAMLASLASRHYFGDPSQSFLVTRLSEDTFEDRSRIFRERLTQTLGRSALVNVQRERLEVRTAIEAQHMIEQQPRLLGVVWGSERWISISFPKVEPLLLKGLSATSIYPELAKLRLVRSVPAIGLSFLPRTETALFLARLFEAKRALTHGLPAAELSLIAAGRVIGGWNGQAHRAYPWWLLGTSYLENILSSSRVELGEVRCAVQALTWAKRYLPWGSNPELRSAILNNLAVAVYLEALVSGKGHAKKLPRDLFKAGASARKEPNFYRLKLEAPRVAQHNLKMLGKKKAAPSSGHAKKGKRHRKS